MFNTVPGIQTRLQNGVGGISHYIFVSGYLNMKNHRGAFLAHARNYVIAKSNMAATSHDENPYLLGF